MIFPFALATSVKSISQQALLRYWDRQAKDQLFPSVLDFNPTSRMHDPKQLAIWSVERERHEIRFRSLHLGGNIAEVFSSSWCGQMMERIVPQFLKAPALEAANECVCSGCAVYTIISSADENGAQIDCERLLLPLGRDGMTVEQLVSSLQLISITGNFDRRSVLRRFELAAEVTFAAKIRSRYANALLAPAPE